MSIELQPSTVKNFAAEAVTAWDPDPERIVADFKNLAYGLAKSYQFCGLPLDDLRQEALLGLLDAAGKFDPGRGVLFSTYATWWIKKRLLRAARQETKALRAISSNDLLENVPAVPEELAPDSRPVFELPSGLDENERSILTLCYRDRLPLCEVAKQTGLSVERVKQLRAKALRRLRSQLGVSFFGPDSPHIN